MSALNLAGLIGVVASVVGIPLTYLLAKRSRQRPALRYAIDFGVLIDPTDTLMSEGLVIQFQDTPIRVLSRTILAIWNERGDTVRGLDVVADDPLRLAFDGPGKPLQARILTESRPATKIRAVVEGDAVEVRFDFMDEGDGALIEVLHTGDARPAVEGTVRGATIRTRQERARLTLDDLGWMRERGRWARLRSRLRGIPPRRRRLTIVSVVSGVGLLLVVMVMAVTEYRQDGYQPRLIDSSVYNLGALEGQSDFATKVRRTGLRRQMPLYLSAGAYPLMLILLGLRAGLGSTVIPRCITRCDVSHSDPAESTGSTE